LTKTISADLGLALTAGYCYMPRWGANVGKFKWTGVMAGIIKYVSSAYFIQYEVFWGKLAGDQRL